MKLSCKEIVLSSNELEKIVGQPCEVIYDNKGFILTGPRRGIKEYPIAELHANREDAKQIIKQINTSCKLVEVIARNLVAWDTSKDKKQGLLPEVYLTNKQIYRELVGEEYEFARACEKFHIGDDWS
jgi:hypothetical protein